MATKFVAFSGTSEEGKAEVDKLVSVRVSEGTRNDAKPVIGSNYEPIRKEYRRLKFRWAQIGLQLLDLSASCGAERKRLKSPGHDRKARTQKWLIRKKQWDTERERLVSSKIELERRMAVLSASRMLRPEEVMQIPKQHPRKHLLLRIIRGSCVLLLCLLSGCGPYEPQPPLVSRIEHNGHDYLKFYELGSTSFVHDPECKCSTDSK